MDINTESVIEFISNWRTVFIPALIGLVVSFAVFLRNIDQILSTLDGFRNRRVKRLTDAIVCDEVSDNFKKLIKEEIEKEHFKRCFKHTAPTKVRELILHTYYLLDKTIPFHMFVNALSHIEAKGDSIAIHISRYDKFNVAMNTFAGFMFFVAGFLALPLFMLSKPVYVALPAGVLIFLYGFAMAAYFVSQTWSVTHAKKIKQALEEFERKSAADRPET